MAVSTQTGTLTTNSGAGSTVQMNLPAAEPTCTSCFVTVNGTYSGVTVVFEIYDGTNWYIEEAVQSDTNTGVNSQVMSTNQTYAWHVDVEGSTAVRIRASAYSTGTVNVSMFAGVWPIVKSNTFAQGTAAALSSAWPVQVTDGTHTLPTMDAAARAGFVKPVTASANVFVDAISNPTAGTGVPVVANGMAPLASFSAQSALNTIGTALDNGVARSNHSLFVFAGASVASGVVTLMGSNDGTNYFATACTVTTNAASTAFANNLANFPYRYILAKITTVIGGGTVTAYVASC